MGRVWSVLLDISTTLDIERVSTSLYNSSKAHTILPPPQREIYICSSLKDTEFYHSANFSSRVSLNIPHSWRTAARSKILKIPRSWFSKQHFEQLFLPLQLRDNIDNTLTGDGLYSGSVSVDHNRETTWKSVAKSYLGKFVSNDFNDLDLLVPSFFFYFNLNFWIRFVLYFPIISQE